MAAGAATSYTVVKRFVAGNVRINIVDVLLTATYGAGGYTLSAANCGLKTIHAVVGCHVTTGENVLIQPVLTAGAWTLEVLKGASTVTVTAGNAAFTEAAVNESIISATTNVRCTVYGDAVTG